MDFIGNKKSQRVNLHPKAQVIVILAFFTKRDYTWTVSKIFLTQLSFLFLIFVKCTKTIFICKNTYITNKLIVMCSNFSLFTHFSCSHDRLFSMISYHNQRVHETRLVLPELQYMREVSYARTKIMANSCSRSTRICFAYGQLSYI